MRVRSPFLAGTALALASAATFGVTAPLVQRFGSGLGPFTTAGLLYAGAVFTSARAGRADAEARVRARHWPRLLFAAVAGALVAPASLAFGLQRTSGTAASLMLNLEAVFTAVLAALMLREHLGRRVLFAIFAMFAGTVCLLQGGGSAVVNVGLAAVALATLGWALDNVVLRPLADLDPASVVFRKASLGALMSLVLSRLAVEPIPRAVMALALLGCGALGTGVSLRLYLLAQRRIGAGRSASLFALAPFVGALVAWCMGQGTLGLRTLLAAGCFGVGAYLHVSEQHRHEHTHEPLAHEHAHRHDDGHHDHVHEPPVLGEHSHPHAHAAVTHDHPHGPDLHHQHRHRHD